jgi:hypothetical protein
MRKGTAAIGTSGVVIDDLVIEKTDLCADDSFSIFIGSRPLEQPSRGRGFGRRGARTTLSRSTRVEDPAQQVRSGSPRPSITPPTFDGSLVR